MCVLYVVFNKAKVTCVQSVGKLLVALGTWEEPGNEASSQSRSCRLVPRPHFHLMQGRGEGIGVFIT